jgi:hypothetical protein
MLPSILYYELPLKVQRSRKMTRDSLPLAHKQKTSMILKIVTATLAAFLLAIPTSGQSSGRPQDQKPPQSENPSDDLINPDRPGIADGSNVIGAKRLQIETGLQEEFRRDGDSREHTIFIPTLIRVGIDNHWEVRVEGNTFTRVVTFDATDVASQISGFAPVSLGIKYHIYDFKGARQASLGTIVRVFPAWGSADFRPDHVTGDVRLAVDWDFVPKLKLSLNPNVGVGRYEDDQGRIFTSGLLAVTLNYLPTKKLNPFIDVGLQTPEKSDGRSSVILDAGVAYIIGRNLQLDASVGTGAHGDTTPHPFIGFGISFRSKVWDKERH